VHRNCTVKPALVGIPVTVAVAFVEPSPSGPPPAGARQMERLNRGLISVRAAWRGV
jgi:hypothetical protein